MSGFSPTYTNRGNLKCPYCAKTWKRQTEYIEKHIRAKHLEQAIRDEADSKLSNALARNKELESQLATAKQPPKPEGEFYDAVVFCSNCQLLLKVGMPKGILTENVVHSICGNKTLKLVNNAPNWW